MLDLYKDGYLCTWWLSVNRMEICNSMVGITKSIDLNIRDQQQRKFWKKPKQKNLHATNLTISWKLAVRWDLLWIEWWNGAWSKCSKRESCVLLLLFLGSFVFLTTILRTLNHNSDSHRKNLCILTIFICYKLCEAFHRYSLSNEHKHFNNVIQVITFITSSTQFYM